MRRNNFFAIHLILYVISASFELRVDKEYEYIQLIWNVCMFRFCNLVGKRLFPL